MSFHPAYPSATDLSREADAEERDVADLVALRTLRGIVADAIARAGRIAAGPRPTCSRRCRTSSRTSTTPPR